jgi:hypothetical protein
MRPLHKLITMLKSKSHARNQDRNPEKKQEKIGRIRLESRVVGLNNIQQEHKESKEQDIWNLNKEKQLDSVSIN